MNKYNQDKVSYRCDWFTDFLRKAVGQKKLTVEQIADKAGLSKSTVMSWMTGTRSPGVKTFLLLIDALGYELHITEK